MEVDGLQMQVDTREHAKEWGRIKAQFDALNVSYFRSKMYVGDYMLLDNPRVVIDRKKDLQELVGNVCQQHERFKAELVRAMQQGIKIIILCEHGKGIECIDDVKEWKNPRKNQIRWRTVNGKRTPTVISSKAVDGDQLYKSLCTIRDRYGVEFVFCEKQDTGKRIAQILGSYMEK